MTTRPALDVSPMPAYVFGPRGLMWWGNGSAVWTIMGFHTFLLVADMLDTIVLTALMFTGRIAGTRFVDVYQNAVYWYFVVVIWLPLYAVVYIAPRLL